jgi:hypothetical protein
MPLTEEAEMSVQLLQGRPAAATSKSIDPPQLGHPPLYTADIIVEK